MDESVNIEVSEELCQEALKLENNPKMILALIDLLFMDVEKGLPS